MRNRLLHKGLSLLMAAGLLLSLSVPEALAAPEAGEAREEIAISSVEDLLAFSQNCALDDWSRGKTFVLTADLALSGTSFVPIPIFGGVFDGGGHTVSGLRIDAAGSSQGLFRYLEEGALVRDLHVTGVVAPEGTRSTVGGIAGVNAGTLQDCSFQGTVRGRNAVGGIAGRNAGTGQITGCTASGYIYGENATGGIVGRNQGLLLKCENRAGVNLTETEEAGDAGLPDLDAGSVLDERAVSGEDSEYHFRSSCTDTGGIAGYSSGVVQSCVNAGDVGYPHVGYNAGGIAGRQSGYLSGCTNSGTIHGRKDVGGIAGQAEPYLSLDPGHDTLERLRAELDTLDRLINRALDDAQDTRDGVSARLAAMGDLTDSAKDCSKTLLDRTADFIDENVGAINDLSADITNALDRITPALDNLADTGGRIERLSLQLGEAMEALGEAADIGDTGMAEIRRAVHGLRQSGEHLDDAAKALRQALEALLKTVISGGSREEKARALADVKGRLPAVRDALGQSSASLGLLRTALSREDLPGKEELLPGLDDAKEALEKIAAALERLGISLPAGPEGWEEAREALRQAAESLSGASDSLSGALAALVQGLEDMASLPGQLGRALDRLEDVSRSAAAIGRLMRDAFRTIGDAVEDLTAEGPVRLSPLGSGFREAGDGLYDALSGLTDEMDALRVELEDGGDVLTGDLRAVSRQFNTVFTVVLDALEDLQGGSGDSDYIQDTSDEDIAATREGKVSGCVNTGAVEGDRNVGGVVGAMSIEFDLDPEDDGADRFTFGATYETKAVLQECVNRGGITAKKDCVGGIAGRMDLGTALECQNYGPVESTGGDYVGGIAGFADASVRNCHAKNTLSGGSYIGGIAGWASRLWDCRAIATVTEGAESLGAVAGGVKTGGILSNNCFVDTGLGGVDGVSYAGRAAPAAFAELALLPDVPAEFTAFTLTLLAEEEVVAQIPFYYGDDLSGIRLPEVPAREDGYGEWPAFDSSGVRSDITVEAVYAPWITLAASQEAEGKLALALAEGRFTGDAVLRVAESGQTPPPESGGEAKVWEVSLTGTDLGPADTVPLRLLVPEEGKDAVVWHLSEGQWQKAEAVRSGSYLLLEMEGTEGVFCVQACSQTGLLALLAVGIAAAALLLFLFAKRMKRRKKAPPAATPPAPEMAKTE